MSQSIENAPNGHLYDAVIVGAGFAGLYMLHRLRQIGMTAKVLEAASNVGGTWYMNRYPGARCDAESLVYSYSFSEELQQEWNWTERYASQPEILRYINHVADRFDLRRDIVFDTRVTACHFEDASNLWQILTDKGASLNARFCIMATGCLSIGRVPEIAGLKDFVGPIYHTGAWPHDPVDFAGSRVGVIGTGSSGIQLIPEIAEVAAELTVFQRTPGFSVPARNAPLESGWVSRFKEQYPSHRARVKTGNPTGFGDLGIADSLRAPIAESALAVSVEDRQAVYEERWQRGGAQFMFSFPDLMISERANETAAEFIRSKIREIVKDPDVAQVLCPTEYPLGSKRICVDTNYYSTFNRPNVKLVDLKRSPIEWILPSGLQAGGVVYPLDAIAFATGFDAITGALLAMDIRGRSGIGLREKWHEGPRAYLGIAVSGFPNMFLITGPGSPSVLSNVVISIEQHVEWIAACLQYLKGNSLKRIEADQSTEEEWVEHVGAVANATLFSKGASWYQGANVPGKPRVFMPYAGGIAAYRSICDDVQQNGYKGFHIGP